MRNFHFIKHGKVIPTVNVEKLWSLVSEQTRTYYKEHTDKAPVIDVVKAGYMKVTGKGRLPEQPVIVKARYFTKEAEAKIKEAGGVCVLVG
mmetsp:Transcript_83296/g.240692  ORF Transcript_83296/g.240692 Transcript_83296/m.240692 type:complete len:91 (-) Transcript_83296:48-320(-)